MYNPVSTYRIQLHKDFTFTHLEAIIPYLEKLGIGAIYASPVFKATPGSMHGYDGVDPLQINPEIGTLEQLRKVRQKLREKGIGWVQDIVPNHMAFHKDNIWLMDVLENGPSSQYYNYFDINVAGGAENAPLMVPFLGSDLSTVIENGELQIASSSGKLYFVYGEHSWPLNPASYPKKSLPVVNKDKALLKQIAGRQYYRLCNWQETNHTINYRRFFTVNGLICLNIQRPEVFKEFHQLIADLVTEGIFDGLRIDHIDGLFDPDGYLQQLRKLVGPETYIVVEKILEPGENLPKWPLQGNTGYDFLASVNNLLTSRKGEIELTGFYKEMTGEKIAVNDQISEKKWHILKSYMAGEWANLTQLFINLNLAKKSTLAIIPFDDLKQTIGQFLVACPVYRFYGNTFPLNKNEAKAVNRLLKDIVKANPQLRKGVKLLKKELLKNPEHKDQAYHVRALHFYSRCMQFTGPLMAKGVEDTLMYTENHFIAHNEVGDSPVAAGVSVDEFHQQMLYRQQNWPLTLNGTTTHDTKRGEDVRARLQVLPDIAEEWLILVHSWLGANKKTGISENDQYFIYQTLIGAYTIPDEDAGKFEERLHQYLEKTLREGKQQSDWAKPNVAYEEAAKAFASGLLDSNKPFWQTFTAIQNKVADFGIINSLAQVLLKFTCPGVPDIYQGCEYWNFSLVDPDNRRPVNYDLLKKLSDDSGHKNLSQLWQERLNGQIKVWLTHLLATERSAQAQLFETGTYLPLKVSGKYNENVVAFARYNKQDWYIVAIPVGLAALINTAGDSAEFDWADTSIHLPGNIPAQALNFLSGDDFGINERLPVKDLFLAVPLALIKFKQPVQKRSAGILMPVLSLPSAFGIGDFGPAARQFADTLQQCGQRYWQMLPLGPVTAGQQYSPYSSYAGFAGNPWYISPELLMAEGLLSTQNLQPYMVTNSGKINYEQAAFNKKELLELAWSNYLNKQAVHLNQLFHNFCEEEAEWLDDYALYAALRGHHQDTPWYQWPQEYKNRSQPAMKAFQQQHKLIIEQLKWVQFIFSHQLNQLKQYCRERNISLLGDLPFYVSYDSADVWANQQLFKLDKNGNMAAIAGVPPDYFNAGGQLWGMPVFNWEQHQAQNFDWWVRRIGQHLRYFDLLRLDHFRAFANYWSVPAGETTAINGTWEQAPGGVLFERLRSAYGHLPFIAEDLGDVDDAVYSLRDNFGLPGMKVLQFAWGERMAASPHIPHQYTANFVAYTGTHDNNTTRGWYRHEATNLTKRQIKQYSGLKVTEKNCSKVFIRLALASVADTVIIPLQDWLALDETARMNTPAGTVNNWQWRVTPGQLKALSPTKIKKMMICYNRNHV